MKEKRLKDIISRKMWEQFSAKLQKEKTVEVLHKLFGHIMDKLTERIDDIKIDEGKAISFSSNSREILTINVTRKDLRIYIHPPAHVFFRPKEKFGVEKFNFWEGSYRKTLSKYTAMSIWISEKGYLPGVDEIIERIPKTAKS
jgi:hypothetical protein